MGVVYHAEQRSLGRTVALKVIRPETAESGDYRSRFLREARLAASVNHPHIVSVFDVGEYDGRLYLAMQWIDGIKLRTLIAGRCYRHGQALTSVTISNPVSSGGAVKPPLMPRCMLGISTESRKFSQLAFES